MVIFLDVDGFLRRSDFEQLLNNDLIWPWDTVHFILRTHCINCALVVNILPTQPQHIIIDLNFGYNVLILLEQSWFWCSNCTFALYDHYPQDECEYCHQEN